MRKINTLAAVVILALSSVTFAAPGDITWFDLTGWTSIESEMSNVFTDVGGCVGCDMTVTAIGVFPLGNAATMGGEWLNSGHADPGLSHSFRFDFTCSEQYVVEVLTNDNEETVNVIMPGTENWSLVSGSTPSVSPYDNGLMFTGGGVGFGPDGVSRYQVYSSGNIRTITVTHASLDQPNKFEFIRIGKIVPEPGTFSLIGMSLLGLIGMVRRK